VTLMSITPNPHVMWQLVERGIVNCVESRSEWEVRGLRLREKCEGRRAFQKVRGMERAQSELSSRLATQLPHEESALVLHLSRSHTPVTRIHSSYSQYCRSPPFHHQSVTTTGQAAQHSGGCSGNKTGTTDDCCCGFLPLQAHSPRCVERTL